MTKTRYEQDDDDAGRRWHTPQSVFFGGPKPAKCRSFRPTHETQAELERERQREQRKAKR